MEPPEPGDETKGSTMGGGELVPKRGGDSWKTVFDSRRKRKEDWSLFPRVENPSCGRAVCRFTKGRRIWVVVDLRVRKILFLFHQTGPW